MTAGSLWHVTLQVSGDAAPAGQVGSALRKLCELDPGNMGARYATTGAELQFWDEGADIEQVISAAVSLWQRARGNAGLPDWTLTGVDVAERTLWRQRQTSTPAVIAPGSVVPLN